MLRLVVPIVCALASAPLLAQQYPSRPVRMIIPFPVGSAADIIARAMEPALRDKLGQSLVIDNRGGAGGNIAAELCAKSAPDGYTIMLGTIGTQAINYSLYAKLSYHPLRDFTPIGLVGESPNALVTHPKVQASSVKELIALAKANPGKLNYGSSGAGTTVHLSGELFNSMAGLKLIHIPYKGATEALTGLLGGQTDLMFASLSSAIPQIKAGRIKAFAVTGAKRSPSMPDLPTMSEAALPGFNAVAWFAMVGPTGVQKQSVATLHKATLAALNVQDVKERLFNSGVEVRTSSPEELAAFIESEIQKWAKVVKAAGARVD